MLLGNHKITGKLFFTGIFFLLLVACRHTTSTAVNKEIYADVFIKLEDAINYEIASKELNAISIALVDEDEILWEQGFGHKDEKKTIPANKETIYRVGSVSKLFTDIAIMQMVESGEIDLDAPIHNYLPDFSLDNPSKKPITLRMLMSHRSGMLREPRTGNYFDANNDNLKETVESIKTSKIIYEPESKTKYSNAGIAVAGYVLEFLSKQPYAQYMQQHILEVIGMDYSGFEPGEDINKNLAESTMWSYDQRKFTAPNFQLGMAPAGSLYAPMKDLGQFIITLFNEGSGVNGQLISKETLDEMWTPQFDGDRLSGYGIGFRLRDFHGYQKIGHGGAIYGFSTQLSAVPDLKIGVACASSMDNTNSVVNRIANYSLDLMHAAQQNKPLPIYQQSTPIPLEKQLALSGYYESDVASVELVRKNENLVLISDQFELNLKLLDGKMISDDRSDFGSIQLVENEGNLIINETNFSRSEPPKSSNYPADWNNLMGEYGDDHIILYFYEKGGHLFALIEWFEKDKLTQLSKNEFAFPETGGMYHGEKFIFKRDENGLATQVSIENGPIFHRREIGANTTETFKIEPLKDIEELRSIALTATPPIEKGNFKNFDLVDLQSLDPSIKYDIRYASTNNFMNNRFYTLSKAFMQRPAAQAVVKVHQKLKTKGYGLLIHDAYRPWYVTKMFWDATPEDKKIFVANPDNGSRHNRGAAVDLTLYELSTGKVIEMVAGYDEMTDRSFPFYAGGNTEQRFHRALLRTAMESEGFTIYEYEWWHFDYKDWKSYSIGNTRFEDL